MKQFFKFTFASILGFFISLFLLFVIFFIFAFAAVSTIGTDETVLVQNNSLLEIKLDFTLLERTSNEPNISFGFMPSLKKTIGLNDLLASINNAKNDDKIRGIFLNLDNFNSPGLARLEEIRNSLIDFKESEKFIIAHGNSISESAYFLASAADSIYLTPTGILEFDGFEIEIAFYKNTLDKLEIEPQIFQYGKYKSATEPFRNDKMSEENKEQLNEFIFSVYDNLISKISLKQNISDEELKNISANLKINSAVDAKNYGLITELKYRDEVDSILSKIIYNKTDKKLNIVSFNNYYKSFNSENEITDNRIAIIYSLGEITESKGDENTIGIDNIIKSLDNAYKNKRVKAIVMRVNSPGGSALTSDMIWRKINLIKNEKPIIVSMSNLAASGGYYISCAANKIVADPYTLTGSIGVFGIIPNAQKFFNNKLGVTFDEVSTSKNAGWATITNPLNEVQKKFIQTQVDDIYFDFVNKVANGRNMSFEEIDKIGQGRIWSGIEAKNIGLVDTLGGINLAIKIAAESAGIEKFKIVEYPAQKETFEILMEFLSTKIENSINNSLFSDQLNQIEKLTKAIKYKGIQTRLPFDYSIN
jgi:protease-4